MVRQLALSANCAAHIRYGVGAGQPNAYDRASKRGGINILARCQEWRSGYMIHENLNLKSGHGPILPIS